MRRTATYTILSCALALAGAACSDGGGGGGGAPADDPYVRAMADAIKEDEEFPLPDEQADCFASRFIGVIGTDRLEEAGVEPEDLGSEDSLDFEELGIELSDEQAGDIADSFGDCGIRMADIIVSSIENEGNEVSDETRRCVADHVDEEQFRDIFAAAFADPAGFEEDPPEEFLGLFFSLAAECPDLVGAGGD